MPAPRHRDPSVEPILELHEKFETPGGFKAEVIGRQFVVSHRLPVATV